MATRTSLTARQIQALNEIAATGNELKEIEHGVYRSLVIRQLIAPHGGGYTLTELGADMVLCLKGGAPPMRLEEP
jgi:hypothetical protein